jgi:hypothetical protein
LCAVDKGPFIKIIEFYKNTIVIRIKNKILIEGSIEDIFQDVCLKLWKHYCNIYNEIDIDAEPHNIIPIGLVRTFVDQAVADFLRKKTKEYAKKYFVKESDIYWNEFLEIFSQNKDDDAKVAWVRKYIQEKLGGEAELNRNINICLKLI